MKPATNFEANCTGECAPGPKLLQVRMVRVPLDHLPQFPLPAGFCIRNYQPGDAQTWLGIVEAADPYLASHRTAYERAFGGRTSLLHERQLFLCDPAGKAIGTATAWFDDDYFGQAFGRVHWVAIAPDWQGKGLGKALTTAVCNRLRDVGHTRAYLVTETERIPAINLYLKFGFVPDVRSEADRAAWDDVRRRGLKIDS
jgi:GNAT superfamily N-acetyltransferase